MMRNSIELVASNNPSLRTRSGVRSNSSRQDSGESQTSGTPAIIASIAAVDRIVITTSESAMSLASSTWSGSLLQVGSSHPNSSLGWDLLF